MTRAHSTPEAAGSTNIVGANSANSEAYRTARR